MTLTSELLRSITAPANLTQVDQLRQSLTVEIDELKQQQREIDNHIGFLEKEIDRLEMLGIQIHDSL